MARAFLHLRSGDDKEALADVNRTIRSLEEQLRSKNQAVRDADSKPLAGQVPRQDSVVLLRHAYLIRGEMLIDSNEPRLAIQDALAILEHDGSNPRALKLAIQGYNKLGSEEDRRTANHFRAKLADVQAQSMLPSVPVLMP